VRQRRHGARPGSTVASANPSTSRSQPYVHELRTLLLLPRRTQSRNAILCFTVAFIKQKGILCLNPFKCGYVFCRMELRAPFCGYDNSASERAHARTGALSGIKGARRWAAGLLSIVTSLVVLIALAAPASGATARESLAALASAGETSPEGLELNGLPTPSTAPEGIPTPAGELPGTGVDVPAPQNEPNVAGNVSDTAQIQAVSPAIARAELAANGGVEAGSDPLPTHAELNEPGFASASGNPPAEVSPEAVSKAPAPIAALRKTKQIAVKVQNQIAPIRSQYRRGEGQYRPQVLVEDDVNERATVPDTNTSSNVAPVKKAIPEQICAQISCPDPDQIPAPPAPTTANDPATDPSDSAPISRLPEEADENDDCGNTNVSIRVSSPGNDAGVSQNAAPGDCGRNTNISIRINSPGDNGPVAQSVGATDLIGLVSSLPHVISAARSRLEQAGARPRTRYAASDPAVFSSRLRRSAKSFARSLVAEAQAKVNRALRQAPPRHARARSHSSARVRVYSAARSSVAGAKVAVSARVSIRTSHRSQKAPRTKSHRSASATQRQPDRLTASPPLRLPRPQSASGQGSGRPAILIALLVALAGAYLLVPPLRPARMIGRR
jgi:hypothetical protein